MADNPTIVSKVLHLPKSQTTNPGTKSAFPANNAKEVLPSTRPAITYDYFCELFLRPKSDFVLNQMREALESLGETGVMTEFKKVIPKVHQVLELRYLSSTGTKTCSTVAEILTTPSNPMTAITIQGIEKRGLEWIKAFLLMNERGGFEKCVRNILSHKPKFSTRDKEEAAVLLKDISAVVSEPNAIIILMRQNCLRGLLATTTRITQNARTSRDASDSDGSISHASVVSSQNLGDKKISFARRLENAFELLSNFPRADIEPGKDLVRKCAVTIGADNALSAVNPKRVTNLATLRSSIDDLMRASNSRGYTVKPEREILQEFPTEANSKTIRNDKLLEVLDTFMTVLPQYDEGERADVKSKLYSALIIYGSKDVQKKINVILAAMEAWGTNDLTNRLNSLIDAHSATGEGLAETTFLRDFLGFSYSQILDLEKGNRNARDILCRRLDVLVEISPDKERAKKFTGRLKQLFIREYRGNIEKLRFKLQTTFTIIHRSLDEAIFVLQDLAKKAERFEHGDINQEKVESLKILVPDKYKTLVRFAEVLETGNLIILSGLANEKKDMRWALEIVADAETMDRENILDLLKFNSAMNGLLVADRIAKSEGKKPIYFAEFRRKKQLEFSVLGYTFGSIDNSITDADVANQLNDELHPKKPFTVERVAEIRTNATRIIVRNAEAELLKLGGRTERKNKSLAAPMAKSNSVGKNKKVSPPPRPSEYLLLDHRQEENRSAIKRRLELLMKERPEIFEQLKVKDSGAYTALLAGFKLKGSLGTPNHSLEARALTRLRALIFPPVVSHVVLPTSRLVDILSETERPAHSGRSDSSPVERKPVERFGFRREDSYDSVEPTGVGVDDSGELSTGELADSDTYPDFETMNARGEEDEGSSSRRGRKGLPADYRSPEDYQAQAFVHQCAEDGTLEKLKELDERAYNVLRIKYGDEKEIPLNSVVGVNLAKLERKEKPIGIGIISQLKIRGLAKLEKLARGEEVKSLNVIVKGVQEPALLVKKEIVPAERLNHPQPEIKIPRAKVIRRPAVSEPPVILQPPAAISEPSASLAPTVVSAVVPQSPVLNSESLASVSKSRVKSPRGTKVLSISEIAKAISVNIKSALPKNIQRKKTALLQLQETGQLDSLSSSFRRGYEILRLRYLINKMLEYEDIAFELKDIEKTSRTVPVRIIKQQEAEAIQKLLEQLNPTDTVKIAAGVPKIPTTSELVEILSLNLKTHENVQRKKSVIMQLNEQEGLTHLQRSYPRQYTVIKLRYLGKVVMEYAEVARELKESEHGKMLTEERIRQIEKQALKHLINQLSGVTVQPVSEPKIEVGVKQIAPVLTKEKEEILVVLNGSRITKDKQGVLRGVLLQLEEQGYLEILAGLNSEYAEYLIDRYGLKDGKIKTQSELSKKLGFTSLSTVFKLERNSLKVLSELVKHSSNSIPEVILELGPDIWKSISGKARVRQALLKIHRMGWLEELKVKREKQYLTLILRYGLNGDNVLTVTDTGVALAKLTEKSEAYGYNTILFHERSAIKNVVAILERKMKEGIINVGKGSKVEARGLRAEGRATVRSLGIEAESEMLGARTEIQEAGTEEILREPEAEQPIRDPETTQPTKELEPTQEMSVPLNDMKKQAELTAFEQEALNVLDGRPDAKYLKRWKPRAVEIAKRNLGVMDEDVLFGFLRTSVNIYALSSKIRIFKTKKRKESEKLVAEPKIKKIRPIVQEQKPTVQDLKPEIEDTKPRLQDPRLLIPDQPLTAPSSGQPFVESLARVPEPVQQTRVEVHAPESRTEDPTSQIQDPVASQSIPISQPVVSRRLHSIIGTENPRVFMAQLLTGTAQDISDKIKSGFGNGTTNLEVAVILREEAAHIKIIGTNAFWMQGGGKPHTLIGPAVSNPGALLESMANEIDLL
ncbi:MAG: hypothetical protein Q7S22_00020 [Candidatus Micrarchaeota archaeon]|nr:hypothetical protein [Candidatus Micrarchaeota archaeon]